jgi:Protein of unknown function (DUF3060)
MKTFLRPLLLGACLMYGLALGQSITIGPDGISVTPAPGQTNVPNIRIDNNGISVTAPAAPTRPGGVRVTPAGRTTACNGRTVNIRGEGGRFKLLGNCPLVSVTGSRNTVSVERLGQVNVRGSANVITYSAALRGSRIAQSVSGSGNSVRAANVAVVRPAPIPVRPVPVKPVPVKPTPIKPVPAPAPPKTATPL